LPEIDQAIGGALPEGLIILQGAPGAGKSALGLQIAASCNFLR
jgi:predicted ATP-dependent serine protease